MQQIRWRSYPSVADHPAARAFLESLAKRQRSPKTIDAYARALEDLLRFFPMWTPDQVVNADENALDDYIDGLYSRPPARRRRTDAPLSGQGLSNATVQQRVVAVRLFYDFCIRRRLRIDPTNPIPRGHRGNDGREPIPGPVRRPKALPWIPSDDLWHAILRDILRNECLRNQAMILLAYDAALRRQELVALRLDDIDWPHALITVRAASSKSKHERKVPVSPATERLLRHYVSTVRNDLLAGFGGEPAGPLFLSESQRNPGAPVRVGAFNDIIERLRARLALPQLHPHTLRHLRCTVLKRCGIPLDDIALFAGHRSVKTTGLYIHLAPSELGARIREATHSFDHRMAVLVRETIHGPA
jgi:integrase/recombinase XerD